MPTFQKIETVDARQFTGGIQNGTDLTFWIQSHEGRSSWRPQNGRFAEHIKIDSDQLYKFQYAYVGDWIMHKQDGSFAVVRQQELDAEYNQV